MFLRATNRYKDGKDHQYWSIVENRRISKGRSIQKTLLYLGEINSSQKDSWIRTIEVVEGNQKRQLALFPDEDNIANNVVEQELRLRISALQLRRPRQWGACWLACRMRDAIYYEPIKAFTIRFSCGNSI